MQGSILLGRYIQSDSWIHRLDPRTKLLGTFFFIIIVFFATNWIAFSILSVFVMLMVLLSGISLKFFLSGLKPVIWLILFTVTFQILFTVEGTTLFKAGPIVISSGGLISGFYIFMRLILIIFVSTLLTLTTAPLQLTDGIEQLMKPLAKIGFPAHEMALMLSIALRYVPTLSDEAVKIMNAQRSRGVEFDQGGLMARIKAIIPILVPLFVSAFSRAEELSTAMEARGYRGAEGRTKYRQLSLGTSDFVAWIALIGLFIIILFLKVRG